VKSSAVTVPTLLTMIVVLNEQQTPISFCSWKSVTEERISMKYIYNLIKQLAKNRLATETVYGLA